MKTIIGTKEKNRRKRAAYHANPEPKKEAVRVYRRKKGVKSREEYRQAEREKVDPKLETLKAAMEENPGLSVRKLAEKTGLPKSTVQRLKAQL